MPDKGLRECAPGIEGAGTMVVWCRRRFRRCEAEIRAQGRDKDADLFNLQQPVVSLHDTCDYRRVDLPPGAAALCARTKRE